MENKRLKLLCVCVYGLAIALSFLLFLEIISMERQKTEKRIVQTETFGSVQIVGNDNTVNVNISISENNYFDQSTYYTTNMINARRQNGDTKFSVIDAITLLDKINKYAKKYDLPLTSALLIVNIESDFKVDAYNKTGNAYGLCQVTKPCLDEYNMKKGTSYKLSDMKDPDLNLEVGFWYYNRILTHYSDYYGYITTRTLETKVRDAYLCYNVGVTVFNSIGRSGRNSLRHGEYPCNMYGSKKGDVYEPMNRYTRLASVWL